MNHTEALDTLAGDPLLWRYRELCAESNPDVEQRDGYRELVVRLARGEQPPAPSYPSSASMAANAIGAAVRFVASGGKVVDQAEQERRLAICYECSRFDAKRGRCRICGCYARLKARIESEHCPVNKW